MNPKLPFARCEDCTLQTEPLVPPSGDGEGYIVVIGEAPGADEVDKGRPFVGRSGRLLHQTMLRIGMESERVYYTNTVMCRPPKNRDPSAKEIACCHERLMKEIASVKPVIMIPLGKIAHRGIFGKAERIKKARGKPTPIKILNHDCITISSIHPAALLRNPDDFPDLCDDLYRAVEIYKGDVIAIDPPTENYYLITADETERMEILLDRLEELADANSDILSVDLETDDRFYLDKDIITCALSWKGETAVSFDWDLIRGYPEFKNRLAVILHDIACSLQNGMYDIPWFNKEGIFPNYRWDTMLASYCLDERKGIHDLERLSVVYYKAPAYKFPKEEISHAKDIDRRELLEYNATDGDYTRRLTTDLEAKMDDDDRQVMKMLLMPAARHFAEQFQAGMLVDQEHLKANGERWKKEIEEVVKRLQNNKGAEKLNPNSPAQVAHYIYDVLKMDQMKVGKLGTIDQLTLLDEIKDIEDPEAQEYWHTQSVHTFKDMSPRTTSTYMLFWLAQQKNGLFARQMIDHRLLSKKLGSYYQGLLDVMWSDGRIRPSVRLHGTVTGRQSSSGPNLHGTPRDPTIKNTYIAEEGFWILYGDYPQAEVRMLGHYADDDVLIQTLLNDENIHTAVAKMLYNLTDKEWEAQDDLTKEIRRRAAKTVVFGVIYGRGARGLAPQLGTSVEEAQDMINMILGRWLKSKKWINERKMQVITDHMVQSLYGRKRRFRLIFDKKQRAEVQRQAVNMPIQSAVSDMTFRAYYKTCQKLEKEGIRYIRWAQIHDAFMILVGEEALYEGAAIMKDTMENDLDFDTEVPFGPVEIKYGKSWGNLATVEGL